VITDSMARPLTMLKPLIGALGAGGAFHPPPGRRRAAFELARKPLHRLVVAGKATVRLEVLQMRLAVRPCSSPCKITARHGSQRLRRQGDAEAKPWTR
jgi:hypothetical protein